MARLSRALLLLCCLQLAAFSDADSPCVIELECEECVPENMPLVTSHRATNGSLRAAHGDEVTLSCAGGAFLAYPLRSTVSAVCEGGVLRVRHDARLRHVLELGCQESVFEDVLHQVEGCSPPLQGRAYQVRRASGSGVQHLATLCFDADRAIAVRARAGRLALPPHAEASAPLSLLGNFGHMFDVKTRHAAERLFGDEARLNRRLHELLRNDHVAFAGQELSSSALLPAHYFGDQHATAAAFVSNRVATWRSVALGNVRHLQRDVARLLRTASPKVIDVHAGTHGIFSFRSAHGQKPVFLKPGRFPVPQYIWTVVHEPQSHRALALLVLNDPFVAVSEVRARVFCESGCANARWLRSLHEARRYETPVLGLVFCCSVHNATRVVEELPASFFADVPQGAEGLLLDTPAQ